MLTFKATLEDANASVDKAFGDREATIETLLTLFKLDYGQSRKQRLTYAISKLAETHDRLTKTTDELLRLKHIEHVTDLIASPFPAHIAEQMRAAGIDEEAQREIANEMLADATPASKPPRSWLEGDWALSDDLRHCAICGGPTGEGHRCDDDERTDQFDDAEGVPWLKADIGGGEVEYRPGTFEDLFESDLRDVERSMSDAEKLEDDPHPGHSSRPSLHGDGHIGPVARHAKEAAEQLGDIPSLHDLLEALSAPSRPHVRVMTFDELLYRLLRST